jgi:hypothetical protein
MATTGKMNDLVTAVKSKEFIEDELKEFYTNLTRPFYNFFPTSSRSF